MYDSAALPQAATDHVHRPRRRWLHLLWRLLARLRGGSPALLDRPGLLAAGNRLLARSHRRSAALIVFDFEELPELSELYGQPARRRALRQVADDLRLVAGVQGLAARTGPTQFTLLITDCTRQQALDRAVRVLGSPCRIELDLDGGEAVLVPDLLVDELPPSSGGLSVLQQQLGERLAAHRRHRKLREQYMRRSRERYSRFGSLDSTDSYASRD
ncbi:diguanylate cyclase domain-containing protein [Ramlibacter sp. Leaf400]|uniref:diguanylate cyclase domain-containing protein n=1 Tax=Ramlibacter sp. Leaf400 TaxID=1736365 RepID=UPI0006F7862C|nr:diguanylate cyclase [Ramlibacter sp. Leaf400]KQT13056.1 hypothetical protein ASG30_21820 [Ramlibacter sp. Leaf400]